MESKILLADDDAGVTGVVTRALSGASCRVLPAVNGLEAVRLAERDKPDLILLDVRMPGLTGWEVLALLRANPATRSTPVIMLTGCALERDKEEGFDLGADDYMTKPFSAVELRARVVGRLRRHAEAVAANPLTRLPGNPAIQAEVERRLRAGEDFAFMHADLDRFKSFNDAYGYERGDRAIVRTAELLREAMVEAGEKEGFLGHVGGDDFVIVCSEVRAGLVAAFAVIKFDEEFPALYDPADAARGWIEGQDRRGWAVRHSLVSLTIGGVSTVKSPVSCYAEAVRRADEVKRWLKKSRDCGPSLWAFDRRGGDL